VDEPNAEDPLDALSGTVRDKRAALASVAAREGLGAEDALECLQDALCTFLDMLQRDEVTAPRAEWGALLAGIVRNAARNRRRRHDLSRPHESDTEQRPSNAPLAEEILLRAESHVRLRGCVAELCEIQRAVVTLRLLDEKPGEDVARTLGISRGHVDVLVHRAKASLRECMLRADPESPQAPLAHRKEANHEQQERDRRG
jgi:RNA polymerase sigma-70 factor (ECF subfamily)